MLFAEEGDTMGCLAAFQPSSLFTDWCVSEHISDTRRLVHAPFIHLFTALLRHVWPSMSRVCGASHQARMMTLTVFYTPALLMYCATNERCWVLVMWELLLDLYAMFRPNVT